MATVSAVSQHQGEAEPSRIRDRPHTPATPAHGEPQADETSSALEETSSLALSFGKYRISRLLARGGMGEVYLARLVGELGFEKRLVIKTILPHLAAKPGFVELFAAEAKTAVALSHGNVVPIYELGRSGETFYIVMGHVDGPSLAMLLDACARDAVPLSLGTALHIMRGILSGLAYAHTPEPGRPPVVHRDITPRNVLVDRSGQVRIVDFGIAAPADAQVEYRGGSTGYAAPEQFRGDPVDPRADVFSAGCLLYELATGHRAFPKEGIWSPPTLANLPEDLAGPLAKALDLDPRARPRDAGEFLEQLGPALAAHCSTHTDGQLAAVLRARFPGGWTPDDATRSGAAHVVPDLRPAALETFATRLTIVTAAESRALGPASRTSRHWPILGVLALVLGGTALWQQASNLGTAARSVEGGSGTSVPTAWDNSNVGPLPRRDRGVAAQTVEHDLPSSAPGIAPAILPPTAHAPDAVAIAPQTQSTVRIEPEAAAVFIDGQRIRDLSRLGTLLPGSTVVVKHPGYFTRSFRPDPAHPLPSHIALRPMPATATGFIQVFAKDVPWAEVWVDRKRLGTTPSRKLSLPAGPHHVQVICVPDACPSRRTLADTTVTVRPDETAIVRTDPRG